MHPDDRESRHKWLSFYYGRSRKPSSCLLTDEGEVALWERLLADARRLATATLSVGVVMALFSVTRTIL